MDAEQLINSTVQASNVFIAGAGPVGLLLAIGLAQQGKTVILAEKNPAFAQEGVANQGSFDGRVLALTYASKCFLEDLGLWTELESKTTEIHAVHVSQKGYLGVTHLHADEMGVPALGYSISGADLGQVLWNRAQTENQIKLLCPADLVGLEQNESHALITLSTENGTEQYTVDWLVGADGTQSKVRELLGLEMTAKDYQAFGIIAKIETELSPNHWSYERFTQDGPVALLPMGGHASKAVLVCPAKDLAAIQALDDIGFMQLFADKMGERLGAYTQVSERMAYPLKETYVPKMYQGRAVLMGNAAHTQHPVAAQGLNLGIADIAAFLKRFDELSTFDSGSFLKDYAEERHAHHQKIMGLTDGLIELFQAPSPIVGHLRGLGLMAMQAFSPLRKRFSKMGMGVNQ